MTVAKTTTDPLDTVLYALAGDPTEEELEAIRLRYYPSTARTEIGGPFVEVKLPRGGGSINRNPTRDEMNLAIDIRNDATLHDQCTHQVSIDRAGYPYDIRSCFSCGKSQGMI